MRNLFDVSRLIQMISHNVPDQFYIDVKILMRKISFSFPSSREIFLGNMTTCYENESISKMTRNWDCITSQP